MQGTTRDVNQRASTASRTTSRLKSAARITWLHATRHVGPGIVSSVAYFDPGNWGVDLQAGSQYGYKLLFIVLLAGIFAVFFQSLASKLGCVTGLADLASNCRLLLYNRPKHTKLYRWLVLYPLYVLAEIAIISTDLAELLGSAIALSLLFPSLPLWAGVLITASDVFILLIIGDPLRGRPVKMFEWLIAVLVLAVFISMAMIIARVHIDWGTTFLGFVPSKTVFQSGGLYTSIGIIGATVMPHSLFLGSFLATQDRVTSSKASIVSNMSSESLHEPPQATFGFRNVFKKFITSCINTFRVVPVEEVDPPKSHSDHPNNALGFVRAHLWHSIIDVCVSLIGFAVLINAFILILASAVFYYGSGRTGSEVPASLFDAHDLILSLVGKPAAFLFALALLCAGQSSSIIATVAGQVVCEGFIRWRVSPVLRRLITRSLGLIPSMIVAVAVGKPGIDTLLVASQVALSIVLPFVVFPLVWLTSSKNVMAVEEPRDASLQAPVNLETLTRATTDIESPGEGQVYFNNSRITAGIGYAVWLLILIANVYVIVTLAMGDSS
ncbi:smf Mn2+ and Fe2+ transporter [Gloeophyllum trabeum ATCC 11539]|uniref:Smf Mn2+ and Fe2+ transporter n=1 Tax=Gloeophyllum trabeum (strain ATCC 11539 / FP-39264 / Madison 617) TaxID=670483 RepID=S7QLF3_GLOTA|nr:smf Mn2+ and Fe2+ transporter [Gloeophyllum trabeum ATCC 11539]EPQ60172.1 smf Mn2+ and Fe2+ transporter [Gloeophyllum trabeum ATCC 11539]